MPIAAVFASHSPLKDYRDPAGDVADRVDLSLASVRKAVEDFAPELLICLGPDHFNGFFYRLMPPFCVGTAAHSVGDWSTPEGPLPVSEEIAERCVQHLHHQEIDISISYRMDVDHGSTQLLTQLFDWPSIPNSVPIFINCAAPPLPPIKRIVKLGLALGEFLRNIDKEKNTRILLTASGGLSHDPPIPQLNSAPEAVRERLIAGGILSAEARAARQEKVLTDADLQVTNTSDRTPLNPTWDQEFLRRLIANDFAALSNMSDPKITARAGCGGHEVRTWIAAGAAWSVLQQGALSLQFYEAIPEWVAGYGLVTGGL